MADYLVVECGAESLSGIEVRVARGTAELIRTVHLAAPDAPRNWDQDPAQAAGSLHKLRKDEGVGATKVVLLNPREAIVTRQLDLPDVPDDELPELVRFQAAVRSAAPVETLSLDYVPLPPGAYQGRRVLAFTHDRGRILEWQRALQSEGMELAGVLVSPIALAEFADRTRTVADDRTRLLISQRGNRVELSLVDSRTVVFSHGTRLFEGTGSTHVQPLQAELMRSVVSLGQLHPGVEIGQVTYVPDGEPDEAVLTLLEQRFPGQVTTLRGTRMIAEAAQLLGHPSASLVGAALSLGTPLVQRLDLVNPRRPAPKSDTLRQKLIYGGTAASLLLALLLAMWWRAVWARDAEIEFLTENVSTLATTLDKGKPLLAEAKAVDKWLTSVAPPIQSLATFQQTLPGTDRLYFTDLKLEPDPKAGRPRISGTAHARTRDDKESFEQGLRERGYDVQPKVANDNRKDPDYPVSFTLDIGMPAPPPKNPRAAVSTEARPAS